MNRQMSDKAARGKSGRRLTQAELRSVILDELGSVAPEADLKAVNDDSDLQDVLEGHSISFMYLMLALEERLGMRIPDRDFPKLRTLGTAIAYLSGKAAGLSPANTPGHNRGR
jgi:acyl carrier protein